MKQWFTLFRKECLEMMRNFKWIWVPLSFILIGIIDPITNYFLPEILESAGGLPEGAIIEIPPPSATEVFIMSMGEYQTLGILIIVLSLMGTVAGERKSGVAELILVRPVSYFSYITSKWASAIILFTISLFIGLVASWYYTGILFDFLPFGDFVIAFVLYLIWMVLVATITILFSSLFKHPGVAAASTILILVVANILGGTFSHLLKWSPTQLLSYSSELLLSGSLPDNTWPSLGLTAILTTILLYLSVVIFKKKELAG